MPIKRNPDHPALAGPDFDDWTQLREEQKQLMGLRFSALRVVKGPELREGTKQPERRFDYWFVDCACGNSRWVGGRDLRNGKQKSCGHQCPHKGGKGL